MSPEAAREELARRADAIEGGYEMMLAYAAQGLSTDEGNANSEQLREYLRRMEAAVNGLGDQFRAHIKASNIEPSIPYEAFLAVLDRDASAALAAPTYAPSLFGSFVSVASKATSASLADPRSSNMTP